MSRILKYSVLCLALGAIGTYGSVLVPGYELGSLYNGYDGGYAAKYNNYEPRYAFEYGVSDPYTGDHKNQWETKDKEGTVRGSYSLLEADGTTRIVDYIADDNGFRAVVKKVGIHGTTVENHGGAEEEATPQIAVAAPLAHVEQQPSIIEAPIAYKSYNGGFEEYKDLKPVLPDVYTKPLEYIRAPKAEGLLINVPEYREQYPSSYDHKDLYPRAEGLKIALPQEYISEPYNQEKYVLPQEKYVLPQEKYIIPQEKYILPQEKYILPHKEYDFPQEKYVLPSEEYPLSQEKYVLNQEKYVLPQEKYVIPQAKYVSSQEKYVLPQEKYVLAQERYVSPHEYYSAPAQHTLLESKQFPEYIVPEYKAASQYQSPQHKFNQEYQAPITYQAPQDAQEYLLSQAPQGKTAYSYVQEHRFDTPKSNAVLTESPKIAYVEVPKAHYNLDVNYHY